MCQSGADQSWPPAEEAAALLAYIGSFDGPSAYCSYLIAPFSSGDYTIADLSELERHAEGCVYCLLFLRKYYYKNANQDGGP
jgi:hypothetical protein